MKEIPKNQDLTGNLPCTVVFYQQQLKLSQGRYAPFGSRVSPKTTLNVKFEKNRRKKYMSQKMQPTTQRLFCLSYLTYHIRYLTCNISFDI